MRLELIATLVFFYAIGGDRGSANHMLLRNQIYALLFITIWVIVCMLPFFLTLNALGLFRVTKEDEFVGLDAAYHMGEMPANVKKELQNMGREGSGRCMPHSRDEVEQQSNLAGKVVRFG